MYECFQHESRFTCVVRVNGWDYLTDSAYESDLMAQDNAAMRAYMECRNFSVNGGTLARNGIIQGLPVPATSKHRHSPFRSGRRSGGNGHTSSSGSNKNSHSSTSGNEGYSYVSSARRSASQSTTPSSVASRAPSPKRPSGKPAVEPPKNDPLGGPRHPEQELRAATSVLDHERVYAILEHDFEHLVIGEYSWLAELRLLGYSIREIADELLENSRDSPWIYSEFEMPQVGAFQDDLHMNGCVHGVKATEGEDGVPVSEPASQSRPASGDATFQDRNGAVFSIRDSISFLCGLGGVCPASSGARELLYGSVSFDKDDETVGIVSLPASGSDPSSQHAAMSCILENLSKAISILQKVGGCCDSFTFLTINASRVELHNLDLRRVTSFIAKIQDSLDSETPSVDLELEGLMKGVIIGAHDLVGHRGLEFLPPCLMIQFLSLSFLSYTQGHCGPIRPCFLDTHLDQVLLLGDGQWSSDDFQGPCIAGSLVNLSCFGDLLQQPVFVFQYVERFDKSRPYSPSFRLKTDKKFDIVAFPEDLLDTWGPGGLLASKDDLERFHAISIGGGLVAPTPGAVKTDEMPVLHWSRIWGVDSTSPLIFSRKEKIIVGTMISTNETCDAEPHSQLRMAVSLLRELGTFRSYWGVSQRQLRLGLQGDTVSLLQFNQTWVKRCGITKKSKLLTQNSLFLADLDGTFGVQVSICTDIARRVRLRDLLADVLPTYVGALVTKPPHWQTLMDEFDILHELRHGNLGSWLVSLGHHLQVTFESLAVAVLFLLQDTGFDHKGQTFVIGCIQPELPFQCFKVSCREENYWARMVADSEEVATFAYITTQCIQTSSIKCRGLGASWANSTALFWTAVSCYQEGDTAAAEKGQVCLEQAGWTLKHSEAYLIGRVESPLLVQVDRPNDGEEPRLLVSVSTIRTDFLLRLHRKSRKPRRLRERRAFDQIAESVIVLANSKLVTA